ncbi:MAG: LacI family transcriptional regulator [Clostridia bacterium]|jgi:LacI family transcriptional regulator|nr:LacI family transcriptional regulator [Clostridia bacterium]
MGVTIKQIAEIAGVSRGTVDRALNNRGNVNSEVEKRIKAIADKLGYRPNKAGKALVTRRNPMKIGVIMPSPKRTDYFEKVNLGVQLAHDEFKDFGIEVIVKFTKGFDLENQLKLIDELYSEHKINAMSLAAVNDTQVAEKITYLTEQNIPVVTFNTDVDDSKRVCFVGNDYIKAGRTAGELMGVLIGGEGKIAIVGGVYSAKSHKHRVKGFLDVIQEFYPKMQVMNIAEAFDDDIISYTYTKELFAKDTSLTALYLASAGVYGACRALKELNLQGKVKVICFDDTPGIEELLLDRTIAFTICQEPIKQGYEPIKILADILLNDTYPQSEYNYTQIIIKNRESI